MKRILKLILVAALALGLVACSNSSDSTGGDTKECTITIGLVTDTGGVDDKSFNQSAWEGLQKYAAEVGEEDCIKYLQSNSDADYVPNLSQFGDDGTDLIVAVGYLFNDAIAKVAPNYPDSKFLVIDTTSDLENVASAVYSAEQGSFLVGVAAGLRAKEDGSNIVGFIGGEDSELIQAFQAGYEQGVLAVNPEAKIYVDYADSFADETKGQSLAQKQYDLGATIIYHAAGNVGNGVIKEAKERGDVWVIGVDRDQYEDGMKDDGTSVILTSMLKRVDTATYSTAKALYDGNFTAEITTYTLDMDGVGAEISEGRNLTAEEIETIKGYVDQIVNGDIVVSAVPTIANGSSN